MSFVAVPSRPDRGRRLVHLADEGPAGRAGVRGAGLRLRRAGEAAVRSRSRARRQGRGGPLGGGQTHRSDSSRRRSPRRGIFGLRVRILRPARAGGQQGVVLVGPRGRGPAGGGRRRGCTGGRAVRRPRTISVATHQYPEQTREALQRVLSVAAERDVEVRLMPVEREKHGLAASLPGVVDGLGTDPVDLAVVLGGDGTILSALRDHAGAGAPVFAVNFGEIGFLSTV